MSRQHDSATRHKSRSDAAVISAMSIDTTGNLTAVSTSPSAVTGSEGAIEFRAVRAYRVHSFYITSGEHVEVCGHIGVHSMTDMHGLAHMPTPQESTNATPVSPVGYVGTVDPATIGLDEQSMAKAWDNAVGILDSLGNNTDEMMRRAISNVDHWRSHAAVDFSIDEMSDDET